VVVTKVRTQLRTQFLWGAAPTYQIFPREAIVDVGEASCQIDSGRSATPKYRWCQTRPYQSVGTLVASPDFFMSAIYLKSPYHHAARRRRLKNTHLDVSPKPGELVQHPIETQSYDY